MQRLTFESSADARAIAEALYAAFPDWIETDSNGQRFTRTAVQMRGSTGFVMFPDATPVQDVLSVLASVNSTHKFEPDAPISVAAPELAKLTPPTTVVVPVMNQDKPKRDWRVLIGKGWIWDAR